MATESRRLWQEIVEARPPDFFKPGSLSLVRTFCDVSIVLEDLGPQLVQTPDDDALIGRLTKLATLQALLSQKLRISVQSSMEIKSARTAERSGPTKLKGEAADLLVGRPWRRDVN